MAEKFASNIIPTKIWNGFSSFLNLFSILGVGICLLFISVHLASAQSSQRLIDSPRYQKQLAESFFSPYSYHTKHAVQPDTNGTSDSRDRSSYPEPKSVLYKSLMIPGWGQLVNKQAWKIPIVYGLIGGAVWYNIFLTKRYHDFRAAHYNATHDDMIFGPTPDYIPPDTNTEQLRNTRNRLRNRRDLTYLGIVLAYGLNAVDAYVFAHMRSFDVSEDLSVKARVKPKLLAESTPGISLSFELFNH